MLRNLLYILFVFMFFSCTTEGEKTATPKKDSLICIMPPPDTTPVPAGQLANGLEIFQNIEQVDYCVPIPLNEYPLDVKIEQMRGQFLFVNKKDTNLYIELKGLFRADTKISVEEYFKNSYSPEETEWQGKIVQKKGLIKKNNCFYAMGYWSNFIATQRFVEVTWLRKDDVVKMSAIIDVKDTTIWNARMKQMIEMDSYCQ